MSKAKGLVKDAQAGPLKTEVLLEVTVWDEATPNHTYLVDKDRGWLLAYRMAGTGEIKVFTSPMKQFSKTKRKFKKVADKELEAAIL